MFAKGNITNCGYWNVPKNLEPKINRAEKYALSHYEEHKKSQSKIYRAAEFEIHHNNIYDVLDKNITEEEYENLVKMEFIHRYTEKMIWKDIWKERKNKKSY